MIFDIIFLIIIYILHKYIVAWIIYYNKTDKRYGDSVWRWTYDYPVQGKRDIYYLFFFFSLLSFLFSFKESLGFFITLESLKDFPLYLLDII